MFKRSRTFALVVVLAFSITMQETVIVAAAEQQQIALIDFTNDVVGSAPALGGPNQPTSLTLSPGTTVLVRSTAYGVTTKPVVLTVPAVTGPSPVAAVNYAFTPVSAGTVRVEATVAFDRLLDGFFLQTSSSGLIVTRLDATAAGDIVDDISLSVIGHYLAGEPLRVRVDVDMTAKSWAATIDNELNGFADDPVAANLPFENPTLPIPYVSSVHASLALFPERPLGGSVAYDDIAVFVPVIPDTTAPLITFIGNAGTYTVDETVLITCVATDDLSGIATTSCPTVASGPAFDFVGATNPTVTTVTATATDNAGNTASASAVFTVTVTADGLCRLAAPLGNADALCAQLRSIAAAPDGMAKAGRVGAFDRFLEAQSGKSIEASFAALLSRLAHLL